MQLKNAKNSAVLMFTYILLNYTITMKYKKLLQTISISILCICSGSYWGFSQITTGGNIGFNIVNSVMIVEFSPEIGFEFLAPAMAGISPFILFAKDLHTNEKQYLYGIRAFGEYKLNIGAFAHFEYEISQLRTNEGAQKPVHAAPLGAGYETPLSDNTVAYALVLYDVLYKPGISYRQNPIIRAGIRYSL